MTTDRDLQIFHELVTRHHRRDVLIAYLVLQIGLHDRRQHIDVPVYVDVMKLPPQLDPNGNGTDAKGLAFLSLLFDLELLKQGNTDYHEFRVTRRSDGKTILATIKAGMDPKGEYEQKTYNEQRKKLLAARKRMIDTNWLPY